LLRAGLKVSTVSPSLVEVSITKSSENFKSCWSDSNKSEPRLVVLVQAEKQITTRIKALKKSALYRFILFYNKRMRKKTHLEKLTSENRRPKQLKKLVHNLFYE
jgi:hypothetical protein